MYDAPRPHAFAACAHWQDGYLRCSEAREAERRLYRTGAVQLADPRMDATGDNVPP